MFRAVKRLMADESGASAAEYAVLVAFIAAAVVIAVSTFGTGLSTMFVNLNTYLGGLVTAPTIP
jgi:pilus assembly protein Flp/PilA